MLQGNKSKYDVVGLGACGVDFIAQVPRLPGPDDKIIAGQLKVTEGGVTANNLTQCAKLNLKTAWIGGLWR